MSTERRPSCECICAVLWLCLDSRSTGLALEVLTLVCVVDTLDHVTQITLPKSL